MAEIARDLSGVLQQCLDPAARRMARQTGDEDAPAGAWSKTEDPKRLRDIADALDGAILVHEFSTAYLLAVLARTDLDAAQRAARWLGDAWDDGSTIFEFLHQWREELAAGRPMTLPTVAESALDLDFGGQR